MSIAGSELEEFGEFRLDRRERQLLRGDAVVPLTAKAFDVLALLVANRDRTVSKEEFMETVWAGTVVEEANLTDNISTLRQALGDDARDPKFIRTIPKRGYRFVAEVRTVSGRQRSAEVAAARHSWWKYALAVALAVAVVAPLVWRRTRPPAGARALRSVAVFPFERLSDDSTHTHLGISLADSLITHLTAIDSLEVRPISAVLPYVGSGRDALLAAREQEVDAFVEGRIRKSGDRVRITVQLVSVAESRTLWARTFDEDASNMFAIEDRIAEAVTQEFAGRSDERRIVSAATHYVPSPAALELYGAGRFFWSKRTPQSLEQSVDAFERAIAIDRDFALAHAGLADSWSALGIWNFKAPSETFPRARQAALAALALDESLAEARVALAYVKFRYDWDLAGAEADFKRAIAEKPNYAAAHALYGEYLVVTQRFDEAESELGKARALDPRSPYVGMLLTTRAYFMRDYPRAIALAQGVLREHPDFFIAREILWAIYREAGDDRRSVEARLATLRPDGVPNEEVESLRQIFARDGIEAYRRAENVYLEEQSARQYVPAVFLAMNHAENGEADVAMQWLERAFDERSGWLVELAPDPVWDRIRTDPRFMALSTRVYAGTAAP
jgi:DNA-binding winged helix-turn-helix (wHTH) protein/TolB-like protein/tetratricopeptide (TPR) repeat protein